MHLIARQATPSDYDTMAYLCPANREAGAKSQEVWDTIWADGHTFGVVVTDLASRQRRDLAILVGTFVSRSVSERLASSKVPGAHRLLVEMQKAGESPFVRGPQLGELNATEGMHLMLPYLGWVGTDHDREPAPSLRAIACTAFMDRHAGNRLQFIFGETCGSVVADLAGRSGFSVLNDYDQWANKQKVEESKRPFLVGINRDEALRRENQWLVRLFTYFPPRFHFTEHQRQILLLARDGYTDNEIAGILGARSEAIKKRWASIYDRVNEVFPNVLPTVGENGRGAEKRRALLVHLRDRPEELRPYTRRAA